LIRTRSELNQDSVRIESEREQDAIRNPSYGCDLHQRRDNLKSVFSNPGAILVAIFLPNIAIASGWTGRCWKRKCVSLIVAQCSFLFISPIFLSRQLDFFLEVPISGPICPFSGPFPRFSRGLGNAPFEYSGSRMAAGSE
jgi:hypothetical protein